MEAMLNSAQLIQTLRHYNVRPSVHRIAVLEYVANNGTHPTADEVFNAIAVVFPSVSRTTVYNSLHTLVEAGVLRELDIESTVDSPGATDTPQPLQMHMLRQDLRHGTAIRTRTRGAAGIHCRSHRPVLRRHLPGMLRSASCIMHNNPLNQ